MVKENDHPNKYNEKCSNRNDLNAWEKAVYSLKGISYLLGITIPAAELRNSRIGHTLLICPYPRITECVLKAVGESVTKGKVNRVSIRKGYDQEIQVGEFVAMLTSASSFDVLMCTDTLRFQDPVLKKLMLDALRKQTIQLAVGKGRMASELCINLPDFSWLSCVGKRNDIDAEIYPYFENVISFDEFDMKTCCRLETEAIAAELELKITESAADTLASVSGINYRKIQTVLRRIRDYYEVERVKEHTLTGELITQALNKLHIV